MAELRFVTDSGRETSSLISTTCANLESELNSVNQRVNSLVGSEWIGQSANQFQGEFQEWSSQMRNVISQLEHLRQRLDAEIADWEQAASALS